MILKLPQFPQNFQNYHPTEKKHQCKNKLCRKAFKYEFYEIIFGFTLETLKYNENKKMIPKLNLIFEFSA